MLEVGEFLSNSVVNNLRNAYQINVFETILEGVLGLFRGLVLNDGLVLIGDKLR